MTVTYLGKKIALLQIILSKFCLECLFKRTFMCTKNKKHINLLTPSQYLSEHRFQQSAMVMYGQVISGQE